MKCDPYIQFDLRHQMKLSDRECPICGAALHFELGYADSWEEPGIPDSLECIECGWSCDDHTVVNEIAEELYGGKYW